MLVRKSSGTAAEAPGRARPARRASRIGAFGAIAAAALTVLAACTSGSGNGNAGGGGGGGGGNGNGNGVHGTVNVFAATSLTDAFNRIGQEFEREHPGTTVRFNYDGSSSLASSIKQGGRADVFASANTNSMDTVTSAGEAAGQPTTFTENKLEIMVHQGNPMNIRSVADLARPGVKVVLCAPDVPCGKYAKEVFMKAGVTGVQPVSEETNVGGVVNKVSLGEADAGMVYETDVKANEDKTSGVPIPDNHNITAEYPMVEVRDAPNPSAARAFINFVESNAGQRILTSFGFTRPSS